MASLVELEKNAHKRGHVAASSHKKDVGASVVIDNYIVSHSPEGTLKRSIESLDGFCAFWEEKSSARGELKTPDEYINQVNTIYSSYRTIRKNLDGTIAYLIGDWLIECRSRFFPDNDRKSRGQWFSFLTTHLCSGFEKTTAYEFMSIAEKLKSYRENKLPLHLLKALLRAKNSGVKVELLDVNNISSKEILTLIHSSKPNVENSLKIEVQKLISNIEDFLVASNELDFSRLESSDIEKLDRCLNLLASKFHSAARNEIIEQPKLGESVSH